MSSNTENPSSTIPVLSGTLIDDGALLLLEQLGSGAFGQVYKAISTDTTYDKPTFFAVKVMPKYEQGYPNAFHQAMEISLHKQVSEHRHIVSVYKTCSDESFVYIVMDLCTGGDLGTLLRKQRSTMFADRDEMVKKTFIQIIEAVQHCHSKGVHHRDLKPENILVDKDGEHIFLADFGLATNATKSRQFCFGTRSYMSPQCRGPSDTTQLPNAKPYSTRDNDVWSLGIILINMLTGNHPWAEANFEDTRFGHYALGQHYLDEILPGLSADALRILKRMLEIDQESRIGLAELKHEVQNISSFFDATRSETAGAPSEEIVDGDVDFGPCVEVVPVKAQKAKRAVFFPRRIAMLFKNKNKVI